MQDAGGVEYQMRHVRLGSGTGFVATLVGKEDVEVELVECQDRELVCRDTADDGNARYSHSKFTTNAYPCLPMYSANHLELSAVFQRSNLFPPRPSVFFLNSSGFQ